MNTYTNAVMHLLTFQLNLVVPHLSLDDLFNCLLFRTTVSWPLVSQPFLDMTFQLHVTKELVPININVMRVCNEIWN